MGVKKMIIKRMGKVKFYLKKADLIFLQFAFTKKMILITNRVV